MLQFLHFYLPAAVNWSFRWPSTKDFCIWNLALINQILILVLMKQLANFSNMLKLLYGEIKTVSETNHISLLNISEIGFWNHFGFIRKLVYAINQCQRWFFGLSTHDTLGAIAHKFRERVPLSLQDRWLSLLAAAAHIFWLLLCHVY